MNLRIGLTLMLSIFFLSNNLLAKGNNDDLSTLKKDNYSIKYPSDWKVSELGNKHGEFFIYALDANDDEGSFNDNVSLKVEPLTKKNNTLAAFAKDNERKVEHYVTDSKIISNEQLGKKKKIYHRIEYTAPYPGYVDARWVQYYFVKKDVGYMVTAIMEDNDKDHFLPIMEEILKSFKLNRKKVSKNAF